MAAKKLTPEQEIRQLKLELQYSRREQRSTHQRWVETLNDRDAFRSRATKAEQDAAEWKRRFDVLLARARVDIAPEVPAEVTP
jgi:hypothetical protein